MSTATPPTKTTTAPGAAIYAQLGAVVLFWGSNWLLIKAVLPDIGPLLFCGLRFAGAALILAALLPPLGAPLAPPPGERGRLALIGLLQIAAMLGLSAIGLQFVPPGRAAVLAYTMPMWALPLGWLLAGERIGGRRAAGALLVLAGVVVFLNPVLIDWSDTRALAGNGLLLASALCWALGATLYRRRGGWRTPFWTQTFWQIAASAVVMLPLALVVERGRTVVWSPELFGVLAFNWVIGTALCYWWWSKALAVMPASQAGQIVCLVPVTALLLSAAVTGEPLTAGVLASVALIAAGIVLTARAR